MRFKLYREFGALNSKPVFDALERGLRSLGHEIVDKDEEVSAIWSVLWNGRMASNRQIYHDCKKSGRKILIIEVGNLIRNKTWRISLDHINSYGIFGNLTNLDLDRPKKLGIHLSPVNQTRRKEILIATQHQKSLQWEGMPPMHIWTESIIQQIRQYSDRKIVVRPHPRSPMAAEIKGAMIEIPKKLPNTYDDFDIDYNYHCVINFNSGPAVQAAIQGIPIICDPSSLAGKISDKIENIENVVLPDRTEWFLTLCHTEWTVDEISQGIPLARIFG